MFIINNTIIIIITNNISPKSSKHAWFHADSSKKVVF